VERAAVVGCNDGDRRDPFRATRAKDAERDLTPVGHQQLLHRAEA
jgi:hypothetical protein